MTERTAKPGRRKITRRVLIGAGLATGVTAAAGLGYLLSRKGGGIVQGVSRSRAVTGDSALPPRADVVVIGGGNIGCFTALTLAERGLQVVLCEKGVIAGEASGRSTGYIDSLFADPGKVEIIGRSKQLWSQVNSRVGTDTGYRQCGIGALFDTNEGVDVAKAWVDSLKDVPGADARILGSREAKNLAVGSSARIAGALYVPSDAIAEPQWVAPAVAEKIRRLGGVVAQGCAVRGLETQAGRISAVVTERGPIACGAVVVTAGIWSPVFLRSLGLELPQFMAFGYVMRFRSASGPASALVAVQRNLVMRPGQMGFDACRPVASAPLTPATVANLRQLLPVWRKMSDQLEPVLNLSTFWSQWQTPTTWKLDEPSPFEANRIFVPQTRTDMLDEVAADMRAVFPAIAAAGELERWAGAMMTTLDNMPVISAVDSHPGLFIGSGFYFGLTMAPAGGEALADLVMGAKPQIDLNLYRFARFSDGSALTFRE